MCRCGDGTSEQGLSAWLVRVYGTRWDTMSKVIFIGHDIDMTFFLHSSTYIHASDIFSSLHLSLVSGSMDNSLLPTFTIYAGVRFAEI